VNVGSIPITRSIGAPLSSAAVCAHLSAAVRMRTRLP
jgi:hypothetical protein